MTHVWLAEITFCGSVAVVGVYTYSEAAKHGCENYTPDMTWHWEKLDGREGFIASRNQTFPFGEIFTVAKIELDKEIKY